MLSKLLNAFLIKYAFQLIVRKMWRLLVILSVGVALVLVRNERDVDVKTDLGILRGKLWKSRNGRIFNGFTAIPYAKAPIGDLRFKAPEPFPSWGGVLEATKSHDVCPQISIYLDNYPILGNEDCLYLNVYTPKLPKYNESLLPVMFYVHGGSLIMGSAKPEWLGPEILLDKDLVLVTTNYRLGAFGFLSTGDKVVSGNNGLKDQALALQWVNQNIDKFGGDPARVTVFGNSAGAGCAHLHMMSPLTKHLFQRAIIESGTATSTYAVVSKEDALANAKKLASYINCSNDASVELIECLRKVDAFAIIQQDVHFTSWDNDSTMPFRPVLEDEFKGSYLTKLPVDIIKSGDSAQIPIMMGIVAQEAAYKAAALNGNPKQLKFFNKFFDLIVPPTFGISSDPKNYSKAIKKFYFGDKEIDHTVKAELTNLFSDGWFLINLDKTLQLHFSHSSAPIYNYLFDYRASVSYSTLFGDPEYNYGVSHTDELLHLFVLGMTFPNYKPTENDLKVSEELTTLWYNFARQSNPNGERWHPVRSKSFEFYHIKNYNDMTMSDRLYNERTDFWRSIPVGSVNPNDLIDDKS